MLWWRFECSLWLFYFLWLHQLPLWYHRWSQSMQRMRLRTHRRHWRTFWRRLALLSTLKKCNIKNSYRILKQRFFKLQINIGITNFVTPKWDISSSVIFFTFSEFAHNHKTTLKCYFKGASSCFIRKPDTTVGKKVTRLSYQKKPKSLISTQINTANFMQKISFLENVEVAWV